MKLKPSADPSIRSKVTVITTFNDQGYKLYARNMLKTFDKRMPIINFKAYYEGINPKIYKDTRKIKYYNLEDLCPDLVAFKELWKDIPAANGIYKGEKSFRFHAVRFSHKMFCIYHAATTRPTKYLIWCDADTEVRECFKEKHLIRLLPKGKYCAYLGRPHSYSECGFMIFDTEHKHHREFMDRYINILKSGNFLKQKEWHDSFLFDVIRLQMEKENGKSDMFHDLTPNIRKNNFNTALSPYIVHYKGSRKLSKNGHKNDKRYNKITGSKN